LEGQKHKKKEAAQKVGTPALPKGGPAGLRCELCDVTCTGSDAYAAHIRGAKHQKVLKLHTKLGKPIPSDNPTVIATPATSLLNSTSTSANSTVPKPVPAPSVTVTTTANQFTKAATPKINFIGSKPDVPSMAGTDFNNHQQTSQMLPMSTTFAIPAAPGGTISTTIAEDLNKSGNQDSSTFLEKDVQPVGQDYIEEMRNEEGWLIFIIVVVYLFLILVSTVDTCKPYELVKTKLKSNVFFLGKIVSFNCKLCECRFNDPNAKEMHMKGRRHRLQYKKKVNPDLIVDVKLSSRQKKIDERRAARSVPMRKLILANDS